MTERAALQDIIENGINLGAGDYVSMDALKAAAKALEELKDRRWIPCSERMPEAHKNVLVCENDGEIHLCRYNANMKRFFYDGSDWDIKLSEVIAWQPLPEAYKPEMEET